VAGESASEAKRIRETCTSYEIAKAYAMEAYYNSYEIETD